MKCNELIVDKMIIYLADLIDKVSDKIDKLKGIEKVIYLIIHGSTSQNQSTRHQKKNNSRQEGSKINMSFNFGKLH